MLMSEAIGYLHLSVPDRRFIVAADLPDSVSSFVVGFLFVCFYRPDGNQLSKTIGVHFG